MLIKLKEGPLDGCVLMSAANAYRDCVEIAPLGGVYFVDKNARGGRVLHLYEIQKNPAAEAPWEECTTSDDGKGETL